MTKSKQRKQPRHLLTEYARVTASHPCPKCGRGDWCLVHRDGRKVICSRVKSGKPVRSRNKDVIGWVHYIAEGYVMPQHVAKEHVYLSTGEVQQYIDGITDSRNYKMIERQADGLGLSADSLMMMHASYDQNKAVAVFPMFDGRRMPTGCRYRRNDGRKYSLAGGREGVFLSRNFTLRKLIWIGEGPTDSAAIVEIGFDNVIGRPNCSGGGETIKQILSQGRHTPVVIVADPDEVGMDGAVSLAKSLPNPTIAIVGPCDIRDFTKSRLKSDARRAIIEGLTGDEVTTWQPAFRNMTGQFHDFVNSLQKV